MFPCPREEKTPRVPGRGSGPLLGDVGENAGLGCTSPGWGGTEVGVEGELRVHIGLRHVSRKHRVGRGDR